MIELLKELQKKLYEKNTITGVDEKMKQFVWHKR